MVCYAATILPAPLCVESVNNARVTYTSILKDREVDKLIKLCFDCSENVQEGKMYAKSRLFIWILLIGSILSMAACTSPEAALVPDLPILNNDLVNGKVVMKTKVEEEGFTFVREYSTPYDARTWRITDSKNLVMRAWLEGANGKKVLVEHIHADVAIKSKYAAFDGWPQDSMDDRLHTGDQPGFWITDRYPWEEIFAIQGFSKSLIDGWIFFVGGYGAGSVRETRLTEENLVKYGGVYGNKIQIVYDLLIKADEEPYFHTRSFIDEFLVPTSVTSKVPIATPSPRERT